MRKLSAVFYRYKFLPLLIYILIIVGCSKKTEAPKSVFGQVTTLAGSGVAGSSDGNGTAASFDNIWGITVDAADNIYVTDAGLGQIRKISPKGIVTTLQDTSPNSTDIYGNPITYSDPLGVAIDESDNLYISYFGSNVIRKITSDGKASTFLQYGELNQIGFSPNLHGVMQLALDRENNIYAAGYGSMGVLKISAAGLSNFFAGSVGGGLINGKGSDAKFDSPNGVAVDAEGNIYVADSGNNLIRKVTPDGTVSTFAGSGLKGSNDGQGTSASFNYPMSVAIDGAENVYVTDSNNNTIRKISPTGYVTTIAGNTSRGAANGIGTAATFSIPAGLAINQEGTLLFVADRGNNLVRKIVIK